MLSVAVRFPLGVYHAQAQADFARAEWPPHPVRLIAALVAAAHARGPGAECEAARAVLHRLAEAAPPIIVASRAARDTPDDAWATEPLVHELRGASRWAPRNHELSELVKRGASPRDPGRGRAEVHKVGTAVGELPVAFSWPDVDLEPAELARLQAVADDVAYLGTSRSPVVLAVTAEAVAGAAAWRATERSQGATDVRVPDARLLHQLDRWHAARAAPTGRNGAPSKAPLVPAPRLGVTVGYRHDHDPAPAAAFDPRTWGDMLVLQVVGEVVPMAPATFAVARAARKALLDAFGEPGSAEEAPPVLRGRGRDPHAAFLPLSFVADRSDGAAGERADGSVQGLAVLLPHADRVPDITAQRERVLDGLRNLMSRGGEVRVPGVGAIRLRPEDGARRRWSLQEGRYRTPSACWTTAVPLVYSRYATAKGPEALLAQVTAECRDVGLPAPVQVEVRRGPRLRGTPDRVRTQQALPASWAGPLKGPQAHLDLWFDRPVAGPVLLGRARHFGVGVCLPFAEEAR